ncbi:Rap1a/Tai family immunity protein [Thiorhodovibrio winogradskyi]|nr:Rap1a/Tai family immunity protein [Thiorhodovibrio winogradskyi]
MHRFSYPQSLAAAATAAVTLLSGAALAADPEDFHFDTTENLYQVCSTPSDLPEHVPAALACRAFIEATVQYHDQIVGREDVKRLVCYDTTTTVEDARQTFISWGKKNLRQQKLKTEQPVVGLMRSLAEAYPCR